MLVVVTDSSPIVFLTKLNLLSLLQQLHERVIVPTAVWNEIVVAGRGLAGSDSLQRAVSEGWAEVRSPALSSSSLGPAGRGMGRGEMEALLLAQELKAVLLTDDAEARDLAERLGVSVSGTLGLLARAKTEGYVPLLRPLLERLRVETGFWMSDRLYDEVLRKAGESAGPGNVEV